MQGPCFCRPGLLSQCVATDHEEQMSCRFFIISGCSDKCMYRNEQLNNHCWHPEAQSLGLHSGVEVDFVDAEEGWGLKDEPVVCLDCVSYKCMKLMTFARKGLLTYKNLESIAMSCESFENLNRGEEA